MRKFLVLAVICLLAGCSFDNLSMGAPVDDSKPLKEKLDDELVVHYLDVGQADAILVELPGDETMLIDAGEASSADKIISKVQSLGYEKLDYVIGTHPHADHIGGMARVISEFEVGLIYMPRVASTSKTYENLLETISNKNLKIKSGKTGVEVFNKENLQALMVAPNSDAYSGYNNYSIVLRLVYGNTAFLFTGDAEEKSEMEITGDVQADVLKLGHHGSETSSSEEFLARVKPKYAVISVGEDNKYNHPALETIKRVEKYTSNIYRTDKNGDITITSDGINIKVETER